MTNSDYFTSAASAGATNVWAAHLTQEMGSQTGTLDVWDVNMNRTSQFQPPINPVDTMTLGPDGAMYVASAPDAWNPRATGPIQSEIFRYDPTTYVLFSSIALPSGSNVSQLAAGPGGAVWFTDRGLNKIGRIAPDGHVKHYSIPTVNAFVNGIAPASDNALWFTETLDNKIGRISTDGSVPPFQAQTPSRYGGCCRSMLARNDLFHRSKRHRQVGVRISYAASVSSARFIAQLGKQHGCPRTL